MLKEYILLMKPGIIFGNAITAIGGFLLASRGHVDFGLFFAMLIGLSLVIASGCVFNNYIDRHLDKKMARTRKRALVTGTISVRRALVFGCVLGFGGFIFLGIWTNPLTTLLAMIGFLGYVVLYSIAKRASSYGTLVGSIAGAMPPVVGYCAVTARFDIGALLLFLIIALWQMPHFYAIAMYRLEDYKACSLPVLPVAKGVLNTKVHMLIYVVAFVLASLLLTVCGYTGSIYFIIIALIGLYWIWLAIRGFRCDNNTRWARQMFLCSLIVVLVQCTAMSSNFA